MDHSLVFDIIMILNWMWLGELFWGRNVCVTLERKEDYVEFCYVHVLIICFFYKVKNNIYYLW